MTQPRIVEATPDENARARALCRRVLDYVVGETAELLRDQPLAIKALMARLLIEDFAAIDLDATRDWLQANDAENAALQLGGDVHVQRAREQHCAAFTRLAEAAIARMENGQ